jgi:hypothetical protein
VAVTAINVGHAALRAHYLIAPLSSTVDVAGTVADTADPASSKQLTEVVVGFAKCCDACGSPCAVVGQVVPTLMISCAMYMCSSDAIYQTP